MHHIVPASGRLIQVTWDKRNDYRIFGYDKPDTASKKVILISDFTSDVEGNPFHCPLGAYYETPSPDSLEIRYDLAIGDFVRVNVFVAHKFHGAIYLQKKDVDELNKN